MKTIEKGLIVDFKDSNKYVVEAFIESSDFYGYKLENEKCIYLFPSEESEYDILENGLTSEFIEWKIQSFTFEGV